MSIDQRFHNFHAQNPWILDELIRLARDAKARGYQKYGAKALWEVMRYSCDPTSAEKYRLSNDFTSRYARLAMHHAPDLQGFFVTKALKDEDMRNSHNLTEESEIDYLVPGLDF